MQKKQDKPSKADFVRTMPKSSPAEIIAAAKEKGITLTAANVHATRYQDKANGHKPSKKKAVKKAPARVLAKYPNMRKSHAQIEETTGLESQALTGLLVGLRTMVKLSVREELRSLMGGVFDPPN